MKNTLTYIAALALVASQMIGSASAQTPTNFTSNFAGMGNKNVCDLNHSTRAERKYLAEYRYSEALKASYTQTTPAVVANDAVDAGGAYMLITYLKQHPPVAPAQTVTLNLGNTKPAKSQTGSDGIAIATVLF